MNSFSTYKQCTKNELTISPAFCVPKANFESSLFRITILNILWLFAIERVSKCSECVEGRTKYIPSEKNDKTELNIPGLLEAKVKILKDDDKNIS